MSTKEYWDKRFQDEGYVWGTSPSRSAAVALDLFRRHNVKTILVPGSGYGRNTRLFTEAGFIVTGMELSAVACRLAEDFDPHTRLFHGSVLDMSSIPERYDAIYCFNVLHLLPEGDRETFIRECGEKLRDGGLAYFTAFSDHDPGKGRGKQLGKNTFESRPGRPAHYFSEEALRSYFHNCEVLETGIMEDPEDHGEGPHTHVLRYILARKSARCLSAGRK
jgi:SAM-dependent methyltransferase